MTNRLKPIPWNGGCRICGQSGIGFSLFVKAFVVHTGSTKFSDFRSSESQRGRPMARAHYFG